MTAPPIAAALARVAELHAAASKGPWTVNPLNAIVDAFVGGIQLAVCKLLWPTKDRTEQETEANAAFIAESRELLPQMAAEVSRQAEEIERLTERATTAERERDDYARMCADSEMVHLNILRGGIAKPSRMSLLHLAGATDYDGLKDRVEQAERERDEARAALEAMTRLWGQTGNTVDDFEDVARWFHQETGFVRPGKDCRINDSDIRRTHFDAWRNEKVAQARALLTKEKPNG